MGRRLLIREKAGEAQTKFVRAAADSHSAANCVSLAAGNARIDSAQCTAYLSLMQNLDRFDVDEMLPIGGDLWKATLVLKSPETVSGRAVAQACRVIVRFAYPPEAPSGGLIQAAVDKAKEALAKGVAILEADDVATLQADYQRSVASPFGVTE